MPPPLLFERVLLLPLARLGPSSPAAGSEGDGKSLLCWGPSDAKRLQAGEESFGDSGEEKDVSCCIWAAEGSLPVQFDFEYMQQAERAAGEEAKVVRVENQLYDEVAELDDDAGSVDDR